MKVDEDNSDSWVEEEDNTGLRNCNNHSMGDDMDLDRREDDVDKDIHMMNSMMTHFHW